MLILMLMLSPGPEMDTRICRDGPSRGATEDHYSPQKGSSAQPNRDPPQILQIVPPRCCHHHHHHQDRLEVSPPADGGGGAAPDAPERSQEWDLASPALPLRGRLPSPHLLPPLITKCKASPTSSSPRPLVVDEAELRHTAAPARLDGVHVRGPPLHSHPQLLIPSQQQQNSCSKLGIPTGHRHSHMSENLTGSHTAEQTRREHHCAGRRAAAN